MLPAALKAKYEKKVKLADGCQKIELPIQRQKVLQDEQTDSLERRLEYGDCSILQRRSKGHLKVIHMSKRTVKKKTFKVGPPLLDQ